MAQVYDWKISIIAQYNEKWKPEYDEFIQAVKKQIRISEKLVFIVFTYFTNDDPGSNGACSVVQYYKGMPELPVPPEPCDLYDPETLNRFFREKVKPVSATWHTSIVWGHGAGLGYFPEIIESLGLKRLFVEIFNPEPVMDNKTRQEAIGWEQAIDTIHYLQANLSMEADFSLALSKPVRFGDDVYEVKETAALNKILKVITAKRLGEALAELGHKTEIVIASSCYCHLFETGFYLKNTASIFIAAQTSIPISGFNYTSFFNKLRLHEKPAAGDAPAVKKYLKELAENVVLNFHKKYTRPYLKKIRVLDPILEYNKERIAISANDLSYYDAIKESVDELGTVLLSCHLMRDPDYKSAVGNARDNCLDMDYPWMPKGIIDLLLAVSFLKAEFHTLSDERMDDILVGLENIKKICNLALLTSPWLTGNPVPDCGRCTQNPQFLSFFFPGTVNTNGQLLLYKLFLKDPAGSNTIKISEPWTRFIREFVEERL